MASARMLLKVIMLETKVFSQLRTCRVCGTNKVVSCWIGNSVDLHTAITMDEYETLYHTNEECSTRIFGYGSLLWKPDFQYSDKQIGFIKGYKRRFWQGNDTHRGTQVQTGRVATLVPSKQGIVWGVMYEVNDLEAKKKALGGLTKREVTLGGYDVINTTFYPRDENHKPSEAIVFMATKKNKLFLGKGSIDTMAMQIVNAKGHAGSNIEYVTKMADYIRAYIPEDTDGHLFNLDKHVRMMSGKRFCLNRMIGRDEFFHINQLTDGECIC